MNTNSVGCKADAVEAGHAIVAPRAARARHTPSAKSLQSATLPQKSVTYILYVKMQPVFLLQPFSLEQNRFIRELPLFNSPH